MKKWLRSDLALLKKSVVSVYLIIFFLIDWLTSVPGQSGLARCKCCKVELKAHKKDLESHAQTNKHVKKMAESDSVAHTPKITQFANVAIDDRRKIAELKIAEHCSVSTVDHLGN